MKTITITQHEDGTYSVSQGMGEGMGMDEAEMGGEDMAGMNEEGQRYTDINELLGEVSAMLQGGAQEQEQEGFLSVLQDAQQVGAKRNG